MYCGWVSEVVYSEDEAKALSRRHMEQAERHRAEILRRKREYRLTGKYDYSMVEA